MPQIAPFDVAEQLGRLPAQPLAAMQVLRLAEDPRASAAQLGDVVEMDPVISARVLRVANSSYYGLRAQVGSASRAVILLGFSTVKAVAAAAACGLLSEDVSLGPPDFWAHSLSVACAASVAAELLGVPTGEAFSAGLLHDIGTALLHRFDPDGYEQAVAESGPGELLAEERRRFGTHHAAAGAEALDSWRFPPGFVEAVRSHHAPVSEVQALTQAVILGEAIAERVERLGLPEPSPDLDATLEALDLGGSLGPLLVARTEAELGRIAGCIKAAL